MNMSSNEEDYYSCAGSDHEAINYNYDDEGEVEFEVSRISLNAQHAGTSNSLSPNNFENSEKPAATTSSPNLRNVTYSSPTYRNNSNSPSNFNQRNGGRPRGYSGNQGNRSMRGGYNYQATRPIYSAYQNRRSPHPFYSVGNNQQSRQAYDEYQRDDPSPAYDENEEGYSDCEEAELEKLPEIMRQILTKSKSYSEKMAIIANRILIQTTITSAYGGYQSFELLNEHFHRDASVNGEVIADYMGYNSFADMCLNAPEIVDLHKWTYSNTDAVIGYQPVKLSKSNARLVNDKIIGERERSLRHDEIGRYIEEMKATDALPTIKELDFKYRLCQTMEGINGMKISVELGTLKREHEKRHNEVLNSKTYRCMYSLVTNHDFTNIQKQRLRIEMTVKPNVENKGLVFRLRHPLDVISNYHNRVKEEIRKKEANEQAKREEMKRIGYIRFQTDHPQHLNARPPTFNPPPIEDDESFEPVWQ